MTDDGERALRVLERQSHERMAALLVTPGPSLSYRPLGPIDSRMAALMTQLDQLTYHLERQVVQLQTKYNASIRDLVVVVPKLSLPMPGGWESLGWHGLHLRLGEIDDEYHVRWERPGAPEDWPINERWVRG